MRILAKTYQGPTAACTLSGAELLCEDLLTFQNYQMSELVTCLECENTFTAVYLRTGLILDDGSTYAVVTPVNAPEQHCQCGKENA